MDAISILIFLSCAAIVVVGPLILFKKIKQLIFNKRPGLKINPEKERSFLEPEPPSASGNIFLESAHEMERRGDYLGARVEYMKCIEDMKRSSQEGTLDKAIELAQMEYDEFVKRDPVYAALLSRLIPIIKAQPGMMQSDITKHFKKAEWWPELTNYNREVTKEDIGYALYFAAKQGVILRTKKGRSYELRVVEDVPTPVK